MPSRERRRSLSSRAHGAAPPRPKLGALHRYTINGLYGQRKISFALDENEPTLLTGVNGTGKSTVLRTIDAVSTGQWPNLFAIPFLELRLEFENGDVFSAYQKDEECGLALSDHEQWRLPRWFLSRDIRFTRESVTRVRPESAAMRRMLELAPERIWDISADLNNDAIRTYFRSLDIAPPPDWVLELPERFPVLFITDQRLVIEGTTSGEKSRAVPVSTNVAAEEAAKHIAQEIALAQARYASRSQSLDRDFPRRVLDAMAEPPAIDNSELRLQLHELAEQRRHLQLSGLLPSDETNDFGSLGFDLPNANAVIFTYINDTQDKLAVLEPLRRRLALFTDFLSQHYRAAKKIRVDQQAGFVITVEGQEDPLPPAKLSSGEQQILVLAHHILFRAAENTLVLIDEPELSLHVVWQATLVDDLSQMGRERDLSFLLATHSPTLIAGREDLKRSLDR